MVYCFTWAIVHALWRCSTGHAHLCDTVEYCQCRSCHKLEKINIDFMTLMKYGIFCFQLFVLPNDKSLFVLLLESEICGLRMSRIDTPYKLG